MMRIKRSLTTLLLIFLFCVFSTGHAQDFIEYNTGFGTFTVPGGVTQITVHVWGAGGGGGGVRANATPGSAGGGGGGAYSRKVMAVLGGQTYDFVVGIGGSGGSGAAGDAGASGGQSSFGVGDVVAAGGTGGAGSTAGAFGGGGAGGTVAAGVGDFRYAGGNGAAGLVDRSGGGGGGAGTTGDGGNAVDAVGGAGTGAGGGSGANGALVEGNGSPGFTRGGGGSGAMGGTATDRDGGAGADGFVRVVYPTPIGITKDRDLDFGTFAVTGAGEVIVAADAAGARNKTGDVMLAGSNSLRCAEFTMSGAAMRFVASLLVEPTELSGPTTIPVSFVIGYENQNSADGTKVFVGGTLTLAGTEPAGSYSAAATISVAYE